VTIPAGALASDQEVTLSLLPNLSQQPPSGFIVGVGDALVLSTSTPPFTTSTGNIQFAIGAGTSSNGLQGSAPLADLIDSTGDNFFGVAGSFDTSTNLSSITVPAALMTGTNSVVVSMANLSPTYASPSVARVNASRRPHSATANAGPPSPGQRSWNGSAWVPYSGCSAPPGTKVLVLVHGMLSSVEDAYGNGGAMVTALDGTTDYCVNQIQKAGGKNDAGALNYGQVVGFDYDWSNDIGLSSGASFASFLNTLASCGNEIDIEAHSEGGPVAASGIIQALPQTQSLIGNLVGLGNPWTGTAAANGGTALKGGFVPLTTELMDWLFPGAASHVVNSVPTQGKTLQAILNSPFVLQLESNSALLTSIQQQLGQHAPQLNMVLACGTQPQGYQLRFTEAIGSLFSSANDGIVPLNSCQGAGPTGTGNVFADLTPDRLPTYSLSHTQLACDPHVIHDVGQAIQGPASTGASLVATPTSLAFSATQGAANPSGQTLTISSPGATLTWSATTTAAWLSVSPSSGKTQGTGTVSADITGLSPGTYNGSITIAATGATNSPLTIPVSLTVSSAAGVTGTWNGTLNQPGDPSYPGCVGQTIAFSLTLDELPNMSITGSTSNGRTITSGSISGDLITVNLSTMFGPRGPYTWTWNGTNTITGSMAYFCYDLSTGALQSEGTETFSVTNN